MIHYLTCGFRPVISTSQIVISRGIPIFGSFCKPLRNIVAETFAEPSENFTLFTTFGSSFLHMSMQNILDLSHDVVPKVKQDKVRGGGGGG